MMPYAKWQALCASDPAKANAICAEKMGFTYYENDYGPVCFDRQGKRIEQPNWGPTSDRNHAAIMVEKVAKSGEAVRRFIDTLGEATGGRRVHPLNGTVSVSWQPVDVLLAPPSLIAYCACCALEPLTSANKSLPVDKEAA